VAVAAMVAAMVTMALNAQTGMVAKYAYGDFFLPSSNAYKIT